MDLETLKCQGIGQSLNGDKVASMPEQ